MTKNTFNKSERLTGKLNFKSTFIEGKGFFVAPFKIVVKKEEFSSSTPCKLGISVPKKKFKKAVDRNRIKRLIREAYRQNKHEHYQALENKKIQISLILIYTSTEMPTYKQVEDKIILSLHRLQKHILNEF